MRNAFFIYDCWLLTCLSYSTKIAMKMSRVNFVVEKDALSESDIEEEEEDEGEDEVEKEEANNEKEHSETAKAV